MHYPIRGLYGLPGGHVEKKEDPDMTIRRELKEELGIEIEPIHRKDFFLREGTNGPIILAYWAIAPSDLTLHPSHPRFEIADWVAKKDIADIPTMSPEYKRFVLENWPG